MAFLFLRILYDRNLDPLDLRDPQVVLQAISGDHENLSDKNTKKLHEKQEYILTTHIFWQIRYETCLFVAYNSILVQPFSKHSDPFPYHCMNCEDDRKKKFSCNALSKVPLHGRWHVLNFEDGLDGLLSIKWQLLTIVSYKRVIVALPETKQFTPVGEAMHFQILKR